MAGIRTDQVWYNPGDVATARAVNVEPPYKIRCVVDGIIIDESENLPLHVNIDGEWEGGIVHFYLIKDGETVAQTHAHVNSD